MVRSGKVRSGTSVKVAQVPLCPVVVRLVWAWQDTVRQSRNVESCHGAVVSGLASHGTSRQSRQRVSCNGGAMRGKAR